MDGVFETLKVQCCGRADVVVLVTSDVVVMSTTAASETGGVID